MDRVKYSGKMQGIFSETWLLFLSVFLDFYVFSAAKYAIDSHLNDSASGYFNLIFMPTSVIYLVANFVIRAVSYPADAFVEWTPVSGFFEAAASDWRGHSGTNGCGSVG